MVKNAVKESRQSFYSSLGTILKDNPKRFWSVFKIKSKSGSSVPKSVSMFCPITQTRKGAVFPRDIASMFNRYFHSCYTQPSGVYIPERREPQDPSVISSIELDEDEVIKVLLALNPAKAHGNDGISTRILKECASVLSSSLCKLYNKSSA